MTSDERQRVNRPADEERYPEHVGLKDFSHPEDVGLKDFRFGAIGLGTCAGLAILFAIIF